MVNVSLRLSGNRSENIGPKCRPAPGNHRLPWLRQEHHGIARARAVGRAGAPGQIPLHHHARGYAQPGEHQRGIVQHELRNNDLILRDYGHLKYKRIDDPRPEPTLESDEDWQAMNCVLDNGVRILSRSRGQKVRGVKHRQHRPRWSSPTTWKTSIGSRRRRTATRATDGSAATCCPRWTSNRPRGGHRQLAAHRRPHGPAEEHRDLQGAGILPAAGRDGTEIERCTWKAKYPTQEAIDRKRPHSMLALVPFTAATCNRSTSSSAVL